MVVANGRGASFVRAVVETHEVAKDDPGSTATTAADPRVAAVSTVVVIGGAGYIGSVLTGRLLAAGYSVRVFDSFLYGRDSLRRTIGAPNLDVFEGDSRDADALRDALSGADAVVHLGELVGDPACAIDPAMTTSVNLEGTVLIATLAREAGVTRFIYPSSCSVYGASDEIVDEGSAFNPVSLYAKAKIAAEQEVLALETSNFKPTVFRLATVYGMSPRPRFDLIVNRLAAMATRDHRIQINGGGQWRPFVHVADVARMMESALRLPLEAISGRIFNLGSNAQNATIGAVGDMVAERIAGTVVEYDGIIDRRNYRVAFDRIETELGFIPRYTLADGIEEIRSAVLSGVVSDIDDPRHSNILALTETSAVEVLWGPSAQALVASPRRERAHDVVREIADLALGPMPLKATQ